NGSLIAYIHPGKKVSLYFRMVDPLGVPGIAEKVADDIEEFWDINSDGSKALVGVHGFMLVDRVSRRITPWLKPPGRWVYEARFSPDDRWISFFEETEPAHSRVWIVPFRGGSSPEPADWIAVTDGSNWDIRPVWSPDGNILYFLSERD